MVTVIQLPPQEAPKQLTAHTSPAKLEEHLLAFLNNNNKNGFMGECCVEDVAPYNLSMLRELSRGSVIEVIVRVAQHKQITIRRIKQSAKQILHVSDGRSLYQRNLHILSRALGYTSYSAMLQANNVQPERVLNPASLHNNGNNGMVNYRDIKRQYKKEYERQLIQCRRDPSDFKLKDFLPTTPNPTSSE